VMVMRVGGWGKRGISHVVWAERYKYFAGF
jgi:hypothetical protein